MNRIKSTIQIPYLIPMTWDKIDTATRAVVLDNRLKRRQRMEGETNIPGWMNWSGKYCPL
jgi:hypothetical protein